MPTGISVGLIRVRAKVSVRTIKIPPDIAATGKSILWSGPTTKRTPWGIIKPTNPIVPLAATAVATVRELITSSVFSTFYINP